MSRYPAFSLFEKIYHYSYFTEKSLFSKANKYQTAKAINIKFSSSKQHVTNAEERNGQTKIELLATQPLDEAVL